MFLDSKKAFYNKVKDKKINLMCGMRNAKLDTFDIGKGDSKFFDINVNNEQVVNEVINLYNNYSLNEGRQQKNSKSEQEWINILNRESSLGFEGNSVLIPRAIRTTGKAYLSKEKVYVSTNLVVCTLPTYREALILASWMTTIFYQLICEVSSKDQEGMRKMEVNDILTTLVPNLKLI